MKTKRLISLALAILMSAFVLPSCKKEHVHFSTTYYKDLDIHYQICDECGEKFNESEHLYESAGFNEAMHWQECECGAKRNKTVHVSTIKYDANSHWDGCTDCDFKINETPHNYSLTQVLVQPTGVKNGKAAYRCLDCDYTTEKDLVVNPSEEVLFKKIRDAYLNNLAYKGNVTNRLTSDDTTEIWTTDAKNHRSAYVQYQTDSDQNVTVEDWSIVRVSDSSPSLSNEYTGNGTTAVSNYVVDNGYGERNTYEHNVDEDSVSIADYETYLELQLFYGEILFYETEMSLSMYGTEYSDQIEFGIVETDGKTVLTVNAAMDIYMSSKTFKQNVSISVTERNGYIIEEKQTISVTDYDDKISVLTHEFGTYDDSVPNMIRANVNGLEEENTPVVVNFYTDMGYRLGTKTFNFRDSFDLGEYSSYAYRISLPNTLLLAEDSPRLYYDENYTHPVDESTFTFSEARAYNFYVKTKTIPGVSFVRLKGYLGYTTDGGNTIRDLAHNPYASKNTESGYLKEKTILVSSQNSHTFLSDKYTVYRLIVNGKEVEPSNSIQVDGESAYEVEYYFHI
ncbi:MAG: hypothetical protein SOT34_00240 [Candidatus Borkfalkiaceae bacterium]|nr:hypothetical protein [Christensenellaceae bacterium]